MHSTASSWLAHQCGIIPGAAAGLILLSDKNGSGTVAGVWPQDCGPPTPMLLELAQHALTERSAVTRSPARPEDGNTLVAVPVHIRGASHAVVAVAVSAQIPNSGKRALELLTDGAHWLAWLLVQEPSKASAPEAELEAGLEAAPAEMLLGLLELVATSIEADGFHEAAFAIVTELAARFGCERVSLGFLERNEIQVCALSHSARFDQRSSLVRAIQSAMEEAADVQATISFPTPEGTRARLSRP
jgi:hypothetical protein